MVDPLGRRTEFGYDALGRTTSERDPLGQVRSYRYDAAGNLVQKGDQIFTHDAANQITNPGFTYDADGNLTSDGRLNYQYDEEDRLVRVTSVSDGSLVAEYGYDYRGLRVLKRTPQGTTHYHWDGYGRLVRESDEAGNTLALYVWNTANQLVALQKNGQWYYPHTNARGDILSVTDAAGNRVASYEYGPWGELLSSSGTLEQPWRYAGYYFDRDTGLYYLQGRYYSPSLGSLLTRDPTYQTSDYRYAGGNPLRFKDVSGFRPVDIDSVPRSPSALEILTAKIITDPYGANPRILKNEILWVPGNLDAFVEELHHTTTVLNHAAELVKKGTFRAQASRPYQDSRLLIREIMKTGEPVADLQGSVGVLRWDVGGWFRGAQGTWQLVIDPVSKLILHLELVSRGNP